MQSLVILESWRSPFLFIFPERGRKLCHLTDSSFIPHDFCIVASREPLSKNGYRALLPLCPAPTPSPLFLSAQYSHFSGGNVGSVAFAAPENTEYLNPKASYHFLIQHNHFTGDRIEVQRWNPLAPGPILFNLLANRSVSTQSASLVVMGLSMEKGSHGVKSPFPPVFQISYLLKRSVRLV